jgi:hypothetical protein
MRGDADVGALIDEIWAKRDDRYSDIRSAHTRRVSVPVEMSYIGG